MNNVKQRLSGAHVSDPARDMNGAKTLTILLTCLLMAAGCDDSSSNRKNNSSNNINANECDEATMPMESTGCECIGGTWQNCSSTQTCADPKPNDSCECIDGTWQNCSNTCSETCTNGYTCDTTIGVCNCQGLYCNSHETCTSEGCRCNGNVCTSKEHCSEEGDCVCSYDNKICGEFETCTDEGCLCQGQLCTGTEICTENGCQQPKPAIIVSQELNCYEDGESPCFTSLMLNRAPASNVTIRWDEVKDGVSCKSYDVDSDGLHECTITPEKWNDISYCSLTCQSIEPDNDHKISDKTVTRTLTASSDDAVWNGVTGELTVNVLDSDHAGFDVGCGTVDEEYSDKMIWSCNQATTSEFGSYSEIYQHLGMEAWQFFNNNIAVKLTANPECTIRIEASITNDDGTIAPYGELSGEHAATGFIFNSENWNLTQTVELKGTTDGANNNTTPHTYTITLHPVVDSNCAEVWKNLSDYRISVLNEDDSTKPSIFVNPGASTLEEANKQIFSFIKLQKQPTVDTTITAKIQPETDRCTLLDGSFGTPVSELQLSYTKDNYNEVQTIVVKSIDNDIDDGDGECSIHLTGSSTDTNPETSYNGITKEIKKTIINDDISGVTTARYDVKLYETKSTSQPDTGAWQIQLNTKPTADVTLTPKITNSSATDTDTHLKVTSKPLVFTPDNYNTPQSITYQAVKDKKILGDVSVKLSYTTTSTDQKYNNLADEKVITIVDSDTAAIKTSFDNVLHIPGNVLRERNPLEYMYLDVNLSSIPSSDVNLTLTPSSDRIALSKTKLTVSATKSDPLQLTITPEKGTSIIPVYIYPINNSKVDGDIDTYVNIKAVSSDKNYNNKTAKSGNIRVLDNDKPNDLTIKCTNTARCTLTNNTSDCTLELNSTAQSSIPNTTNALTVYCYSEDVYFNTTESYYDTTTNSYYSMTTFTLEKSGSWKTTTGVVRSLQCDGHDSSLVGNASFTCYAEGTNYYAKGTGKISYNYNP